MPTIRFYGYAPTPDKKRIGLMLIIRETPSAERPSGRTLSQEWTGRHWPYTRAGAVAAERRCGTLNVGLAATRITPAIS